ncbi:hypothetical protein OW666_02725 [Acinetobacter baumannii]|uniref:hypothetical protein n=1 Tax=Acinetobacter baumannii TaxID=470 RepID=UPI00233F5CCD|nr:hypothetical protein [Acinetobacter baumannii]MDC4573553.1 hypothetical protein [Acinetobacter baumannii]MDC5308508.1 hypothetical protein [Acinetobacter baumannii]MDC5414292.1 hypothetical protein [Acinetobacter baumannii]MDK2128104.1 hypothetical protein [Acinetobacter baumannii]MDK2158798.1 hypothetical protein [Acinetobacter baumannii]
MARSRNIKPSFFMNEDIIELPYEARLLFIGLWTLADREGRLENRPKKIKMSLFPADDINVAEQLENISKFGFIELYNADGIDVIHIVNFVKHQNPHGLEKDSELPDRNGIYTVYQRNPKNKTIVGKAIQLNKADLKHFYDKTGPFAPQNTSSDVENSYQDNESNQANSSGNTQEQLDNSSETVLISDQNALIPESFNLNPESFNLNPEDNNNSAVGEVEAPTQTKFNFKSALKKHGVPDKDATEFMQIRKAKKAQNTENAFEALLNEAEKAEITLPQAIEYCLKRQNPWGAFKASWFKRDQSESATGQQKYHQSLPRNVNDQWGAPKKYEPVAHTAVKGELI